ncbi:MAG: hypothetical protein IJ778_03470, partial [Alphaproteobacteria bacterium]|nr:hypothetical protein [Alphaproteobacteria bacterium]
MRHCEEPKATRQSPSTGTVFNRPSARRRGRLLRYARNDSEKNARNYFALSLRGAVLTATRQSHADCTVFNRLSAQQRGRLLRYARNDVQQRGGLLRYARNDSEKYTHNYFALSLRGAVLTATRQSHADCTVF